MSRPLNFNGSDKEAGEFGLYLALGFSRFTLLNGSTYTSQYRISSYKRQRKSNNIWNSYTQKKLMLPRGNADIAQQKTFHMGIGALFKYVWNINK